MKRDLRLRKCLFEKDFDLMLPESVLESLGVMSGFYLEFPPILSTTSLKTSRGRRMEGETFRLDRPEHRSSPSDKLKLFPEGGPTNQTSKPIRAIHRQILRDLKLCNLFWSYQNGTRLYKETVRRLGFGFLPTISRVS